MEKMIGGFYGWMLGIGVFNIYSFIWNIFLCSEIVGWVKYIFKD